MTMNTRRRSDSRSEKRATISAPRSGPGGARSADAVAPSRVPLQRGRSAGGRRGAADGLQVGVLERRREHADARRRPRPRRRARARSAARPRAVASANVRTPLPVSTSTPPGRLSWAGVPAATTSPPLMIATRSQTSSTSDSRCEFSSTLTPRSRSRSSSARTVCRPEGSSALVGSSSSSSRGDPIERLGEPEPLLHPLRHRADAALGDVAELDELEQLAPLGSAAGASPSAPGAAASSSSAVHQSGKRNSSAR